MNECPRCHRQYEPVNVDAKAKKLASRAHHGCSLWCVSDAPQNIDWNMGERAIFYYLAKVGVTAVHHNLDTASKTPKDEWEKHDYYFCGHHFRPTDSPVKAVTEYLNWVSGFWFYTAEEHQDLAHKLYTYAFDLKFGVPA